MTTKTVLLLETMALPWDRLAYRHRLSGKARNQVTEVDVSSDVSKHRYGEWLCCEAVRRCLTTSHLTPYHEKLGKSRRFLCFDRSP